MVAAACIGEIAGVTPPEVRDAVIASCRVQGLPTARPAEIPVEMLLELMTRDKKAEGGNVRFVLARSLGDVELMGGINKETIRAGLSLQDRICLREPLPESGAVR
jgi:3-dehydroquinate synthase